MRQLNASRIIILAILGLLLVPAFTPTIPPTHKPPVLVSYNPAPANSFHAPLSSAALISITGATPNLQSISAVSQSSNPSSLKTIQQNALRFINDSSYFPQSETSIAVDPANPDHILGAYNDAKYFFCPYLPLDCGSNIPTSISGFTTSTDGGNTVGKSSEIPNPDLTYAYLVAYGDPSVAPTVDGNFFYASLAINPFNRAFGNGVIISKSNPELFNPAISCNTPASNPTSNPCWKTVFIYGSASFPVSSLEDKDRISVDHNLSSPYYGSVYIGWDHFYNTGQSASYLARCDNNHFNPRRNKLHHPHQHTQLHGHRNRSPNRHSRPRLGHRTVQNSPRTNQHNSRPQPEDRQPLLHYHRLHSRTLLRPYKTSTPTSPRQPWRLRTISHPPL